MGRRRGRMTGVAVLAAAVPSLVGGSMAGAHQTVGRARVAALRVAADDPFGLARFSAGSAPTVFSGLVQRRSSGAAQAGRASTAATAAAGGVRVDVYLNPVKLGRPIPLAFALTDATGAFTIDAPPPANLAAYQAPGGQIDATVVYSDLETGAVRTGNEQLAWGAGRWQRLTPAGSGASRATASTVVLDAPGAAQADPRWRRALAGVRAASAPLCHLDTDPAHVAGWDLPQPPTWVNTFDLLVENRAHDDWILRGDYERVSSTTVDNLNSVSIDASFGTDFPGVNLKASGSKTISTGTGNAANTALGFGFAVENLTIGARPFTARGGAAPQAVALGNTINTKYGVDIQTDAHLYDCFNAPESFVQGVPVYTPAYYQLQVGPSLDTGNGSGMVAHDGYFLDPVGTDYRTACGSHYNPSDSSLAVPPGGYFQRSNGQSQTFSLGEQASYGGALAAYAVSAGGKTTQTKRSTVTSASNVTMRWTNNTAVSTYLCGYGDSPGTHGVAPPIAAVGQNIDGT